MQLLIERFFKLFFPFSFIRTYVTDWKSCYCSYKCDSICTYIILLKDLHSPSLVCVDTVGLYV